MLSVAVAVLAGCPALGLEPARTVQDKLFYAQAGLTAVTQTAADLKDSGQLHGADLYNVRTSIDQAKAALDSARGAFASGQSANAMTYLQLADKLVLQVKDMLAAHGG
jgi:hypothetical protein